MKTNIARLAEEMSKISGHKWECREKDKEVENTTIYSHNSLQNELLMWREEDLRPNEKLSLEDFKQLLEMNEASLSRIGVDLYGKITDKDSNYEDYQELDIQIKMNLNDKLDDGSRVVDNLTKFEWCYNLDEYTFIKGKYYLFGGSLNIDMEFNNKVKQYMASKSIVEKNCFPTPHDVKGYCYVRDLAKSAIEAIKKEDDELSSSAQSNM